MSFRTGNATILYIYISQCGVEERTNTVPVKGTRKSLAITRNPPGVMPTTTIQITIIICDFRQLKNFGRFMNSK